MSLGEPKLRFRNAILAVANCPANATDAEIEVSGRLLRESFLYFGSQTPDNTGCMEEIEVGLIDDGTSARRRAVGLRIANDNWPLSSVLNSAEGCPIPRQLSTDFPGLTQAQWDAALRMATMLTLAFEGDPKVGNE